MWPEVHGKLPEGWPRTDESGKELIQGNEGESGRVLKAMRKMDEGMRCEISWCVCVCVGGGYKFFRVLE